MTSLLMRESAAGNVVAEINERASTRTLSVRPGRYFVRARAADVLYEGELSASAHQVTAVDISTLTRIQYARLVRKGHGYRSVAQALELGAQLRTPLPNASTLGIGGFMGYSLDFTDFGARVRLGLCSASFQQGRLDATVNAYDLQARFYRAWDLSAVFVELGMGAGASLFTQRFSGAADAPPRDSLSPFLVLGANVGVNVSRGMYASLDVAGETHFMSLRRTDLSDAKLVASFALRSSLAFGARF